MKISFSGIRKLIRRDDADKAQAGAIIIRGNGANRQILLVTNKGNNRWLFPKGSVKKKESPEEAAEREAEEESGVRGRAVAYVGATEFQDEGELVRVDYFLLTVEGEVEMEEDRRRRWCKPDELLTMIDTPEISALVKKALPDIERFEIK